MQKTPHSSHAVDGEKKITSSKYRIREPAPMEREIVVEVGLVLVYLSPFRALFLINITHQLENIAIHA
ncbi:unnamed protein product [Haemonchus placei]|uniref:Uncharacterized protein n=1 Tax=Haemonchus placei TaxID=6290 RepID=A0A0N4X265_HAEPC|nr:unnamed protein product [Haemonchus placei]